MFDNRLGFAYSAPPDAYSETRKRNEPSDTRRPALAIPQRIGDAYAFPLALFADGQPRPTAFAPIVAPDAIPEGLAYRAAAGLSEQVLVRVTGHVRTRNRTVALREDVAGCSCAPASRIAGGARAARRGRDRRRGGPGRGGGA